MARAGHACYTPLRMNRFLRAVSALDWEERIVNGAMLVSLVGVLLPWLSGEWLGGERMTYTGLGFYTSFLGWGIVLLNAFSLLSVVSPLLGGPIIVRRRFRDPLRLFLTIQSVVLVLASLSVLTKVTFEFSRMEVRFGIYVSLIGGLISVLYAFLLHQEHRRQSPQETFQHPEDRPVPVARHEGTVPPPPPPPPPPAPEEHRLRP